MFWYMRMIVMMVQQESLTMMITYKDGLTFGLLDCPSYNLLNHQWWDPGEKSDLAGNHLNYFTFKSVYGLKMAQSYPSRIWLQSCIALYWIAVNPYASLSKFAGSSQSYQSLHTWLTGFANRNLLRSPSEQSLTVFEASGSGNAFGWQFRRPKNTTGGSAKACTWFHFV